MLSWQVSLHHSIHKQLDVLSHSVGDLMLCGVMGGAVIGQTLGELCIEDAKLLLRIKFIVVAIEIERIGRKRPVFFVCFQVARNAAANADDASENIGISERKTKI